MSAPATMDRSDAQRLGRERFIWWLRAFALVFLLVQTAIERGDHVVVTVVVLVGFTASIAICGVVLFRGDLEPWRVRWAGIGAMGTDVVVVAALLANNTTDPGEPVYLVGVLAMLEATFRWQRWGGLVGAVLAGLAAAVWTVVVSHRVDGTPNIEWATIRFGVIFAAGAFLGHLVRRLSDQHDTLQGILDTTRDLLVTIDERGRILSANAASRLLLGYEPEQLLGRPYWDFFHPDDVRPVADRRLAIPSEAPVLFERRVIRRDGQVRWLEINAVAVAERGTIHVSARDVSERREARLLLEESEQRFRSLFDHNTDAVYAVDMHGRFTLVNPAVEQITGWAAEQLVGTTYEALLAPDERDPVEDRFRLVPTSAQTYETTILDRIGRRVDLDVTNVPIVVDGELVGFFGVAKDITERRRLERQLAHQATHDALTGLPNRAVLEQALATAAEDGEGRTLLFIDLDRFKLVNDSLGHRRGDEVLAAAVERLRHHVRAGDLLVRWAGDEFCVLLEVGTPHDVAVTIADRLRALLAEPFAIAGRELRLSASIGLASASAEEAERLVQIADLAMYQAKRTGRDRIAVYDPDQTVPGLDQLDLEAELAAALDRAELVVHYQPIVDSFTGAVRALEALCRWPQPDGTIRMPAAFVPLAEESGLVRSLTRHVITEACAQLIRWDGELDTTADLQVWVNISVADLESGAFAGEVGAIVQGAGVDPARLVLEVTETMLMRDAAQVQRSIAELSRLGIALAIDDFGTGYSSLNQLHRLEVAACKIDREFVAQAATRRPDQVVLRALVDVGTAFGLPVVAEGIERSEELSQVRATGCPLAQGFLLGRPAPPEELVPVLRAGRVAMPPVDGRPTEQAVASG